MSLTASSEFKPGVLPIESHWVKFVWLFSDDNWVPQCGIIRDRDNSSYQKISVHGGTPVTSISAKEEAGAYISRRFCALIEMPPLR